MRMKKITLLGITGCFLFGCATYKTRINKDGIINAWSDKQIPVNSLVLFGNLNGKEGFDMGEILAKKDGLNKNLGEKTTVLFLGDFLSPKPNKEDKPTRNLLKNN